MSFTTLVIIALFAWIYSIQNKLSRLESLVANIKGSKEQDENDSYYVVKKHEVNERTKLPDEPEENKAKSSPLKIQHIDASSKVEPIVDARDFKKEKAGFAQKVAKAVLKSEAAKIKSVPYKAIKVEPREPSKIVTFIRNYFTGGKLLVRIGGIILFFGLAFLAKYAAEHSIISIEIRLWFIAIVATALIIVGWRLRDKEGDYGQILQGLGIAILYLLIYATSKFYTLLSLDIAFILMLLVVIIGSVLAVMEDSLPLALFSTAGGFLVPILTATGEGSHVILFTYYTLVNLGIFFVAWYRSWRVLNISGFLFTFVIAGSWGVLRYSSEIFASTEPFLLIFFLMYLSVSILFTLKHPYEPKNLVDGTLVFGLPVAAFPLQLKLVQSFEHGDAYSALALGTIYSGLYYFLRSKKRTALLAQSFLALGIVFFTIAIPYIFDANVSTALWSLESAGIIWLSLKQNKVYSRYFGEGLLFLSVISYPESVREAGISLAEYLGYLIIVVATLSSAYFLDKNKEKLFDFDRFFSKALIGISLVLWLTSTASQLTEFDISHANALLFSLLIYALLFLGLIRFIQWKMLIPALQAYIPLGMLFSAFVILTASHPFAAKGALALGTFILLAYFFLYRYEKIWKLTQAIHLLSLWFIVFVFTIELHYWAKEFYARGSIVSISMVLMPLLFSVLLLFPKHYNTWLENYRHDYQFKGVGLFVIVMMIWEFKAFSFAPESQLFFYLPVLNPIDMVQIAVLGVLGYWMYEHRAMVAEDKTMSIYAIFAFICMLLISVIFARSVHMFMGIDYKLGALWASMYFQTGISILWSIIAIVFMLLSKRYTNRPMWLAGFGLLILVVLKLFFVELASSGTIERIISFMVVGSLFLLIGYFVPLPPSDDKENKLL